MTWRRWEWGDAKSDVMEFLADDLPTLPNHPKDSCKVCWANIDLVKDAEILPRVLRQGSKVVHIRAPGPHKIGLKRTRCGRYYFVERGKKDG
jgi:hypothetical protein